MKKYKTYADKDLFEMLKLENEKSKPAFKEIYDRHNKKIYAYCIKVLGNNSDAEDTFQEVFIRFYNSAPGYKYRSINSLLITIARNLCINQKKSKREFVDFSEIEFMMGESNDHGKDEFDKIISIAIETLPDKYKEPLILRIYNGMKYEEVAEICGINVISARSRVFRAKDKLKEYLKPYLDEVHLTRKR